MKSEEVPEIIKKFYKELPHFSDGRIDYSKSKFAAAVNILVRHKKEILILKRSNEVAYAKGKWNCIAGHFDELQSAKNIILKELLEETGISKESILKIHNKKPYKYRDNNKYWIIYPALIELNHKPKITLNLEHTNYKWVEAKDMVSYVTPSTKKILGVFY